MNSASGQQMIGYERTHIDTGAVMGSDVLLWSQGKFFCARCFAKLSKFRLRCRRLRFSLLEHILRDVPSQL